MRNFCLMLLACTFCVFISSAQDNKNDKKEKITGSGKMVTKDVAVQSFDQLDVKGIFNVLLVQGDKEGVKIEADDNIQQYFEVKNDGSKLIITMKKDQNYDLKNDLNVYVTFKKLKSMELKTVGDVSSKQNMNFDDLKISNKSVGSIDLKMSAQSLDVDNKSVGSVRFDGKANNVVIRNQGVGSVHAANFVVQTMDIENTGVGSAEVNAEKQLTVKDSFLGTVTNKGAATAKKLKKVAL